MKPETEHWLVRETTITMLWRAGYAVLALLVIAGFLIEHHAPFAIAGLPGFYAWYGFLSCVALVLGSKALGTWLKRPDTYYDE